MQFEDLVLIWGIFPFDKMAMPSQYLIHTGEAAIQGASLDPSNAAHVCMFLTGAYELAEMQSPDDVQDIILHNPHLNADELIQAHLDSIEAMKDAFYEILTYVDLVPGLREVATREEWVVFIDDVPAVGDGNWKTLEDEVFRARINFLQSANGEDLEEELSRQLELRDAFAGYSFKILRIRAYCAIQGALHLRDLAAKKARLSDCAIELGRVATWRLINDYDCFLPAASFTSSVPLFVLLDLNHFRVEHGAGS